MSDQPPVPTNTTSRPRCCAGLDSKSTKRAENWRKQTGRACLQFLKEMIYFCLIKLSSCLCCAILKSQINPPKLFNKSGGVRLETKIPQKAHCWFSITFDLLKLSYFSFITVKLRQGEILNNITGDLTVLSTIKKKQLKQAVRVLPFQMSPDPLHKLKLVFLTSQLQ